MLTTRVALLVAATLVGAGVAATPAHAADAPVVLRFGHNTQPGSLFDVTAQEFARRANAELAGKVEVQVFGEEKLGNDEALIKGVRTGAAEMFLPSSVMSTVDPRFGVFELPYLMTNRKHVRKVFENRSIQELLFNGLPQKGLRVIGVWENGFRQITNNSRPIVRPEDLRGLKLRVPSGVWRLRMFQTYGATPTPLPFGKVYGALASGEMDAQENPLAQIWAGKLHEVQKYLSLSGHVYTPAYLVVSEEAWQKLPRDVQRKLGKIAWETGDFARREGEKLDRDLVAKMPQLKVNEVDKDAFLRASVPVYEQFASEVSGASALIKTIQNLR